MATSTKQLTANADIVVDKEEPHSLLVGMKIASATLGIIKELSENHHINVPYDPATPRLGICPGRDRLLGRYLLTDAHCCPIHSSLKWKQH